MGLEPLAAENTITVHLVIVVGKKMQLLFILEVEIIICHVFMGCFTYRYIVCGPRKQNQRISSELVTF